MKENKPVPQEVKDQVAAALKEASQLCHDNNIPLVAAAYFFERDMPDHAEGEIVRCINLDRDTSPFVPHEFNAATVCVSMGEYMPTAAVVVVHGLKSGPHGVIETDKNDALFKVAQLLANDIKGIRTEE